MNTFKKKKIANVVYMILNCMLAALWLLPIYWAFVTSIKSKTEVYGGITLFPTKITFENYTALFQYKEGIASSWLMTSIQVCLITMLIVTLISMLAGFALSKLNLPFKGLWSGMILLTIMVPVQALMVPIYNTLTQMKLIGTPWGMIVIYATFQTPFCTLLMKRSFDTVPKALGEAALVDGASNLRLFTRIYTPLTLPGAITVMVYSAYTTWNDYVTALTFGSAQMKTFNIGLVDMLSNDMTVDWGVLTSGSIVGMIPIVILFLFLQKYFVKGIMSGAVK